MNQKFVSPRAERIQSVVNLTLVTVTAHARNLEQDEYLEVLDDLIQALEDRRDAVLEQERDGDPV